MEGFQRKSIQAKPTFGEQLKANRESRGLTLETVELETRIRMPHLAKIEANSWHELPPAQAKGFIRRYAHFLGWEKESVEQELRDVSSETSRTHHFVPRFIERETKWFITPRTVAVVCSLLVLLGFIGYVSYQVSQFASPPLLTITEPSNESIVTQEEITITGKTDPGVRVHVDAAEASVDPAGNFVYPVTLRPGLNQVIIRAENRIKKETLYTVTVLYQAPPEATVFPSPNP